MTTHGDGEVAVVPHVAIVENAHGSISTICMKSKYALVCLYF
jgi:hypothetical protein